MQDIRKEFKGREVSVPQQVEQELNPETWPEKKIDIGEQALLQVPVPATPGVSVPTPSAPSSLPVTSLQSEVESILQEDLAELYRELSPVDQQVFKIKGEEVAGKITVLIKSVKVRIQDIMELIMGWLKMLPGVKNYFLEQEAKIKAEKILKLKP